MRGRVVASLVLFLALAGPSAARGQQKTMPGPLSRAHASLGASGQCEQCHVPTTWAIEASRCLRCHQPIAARIAARKGVHREVTGACEACHAEHGGEDADLKPLDPKGFDHLAETGFSLKGGHASVAETCARCHTAKRSFLGVSPQCSSCHKDGHNAGLGDNCLACHTPGATFRDASRAFHKTSQFALEGKHQSVACASCHLGAVTKGTPRTCYDCHWVRRQDDLYRTRLGTDCGTCHRPTSWTAVRWNHTSATGVALNPSHRAAGCESCHVGQVFQAGAVQCVACHQADYQRTANPNHAAAGFPTGCDTCHKPGHTSWSQTTFNHSATFRLVGVHALQTCSSCHKGSVYKGTSQDCVGCHMADYQKTANPNHQAAGFPTACNTCHRPTDATFKGATFNHAQAYSLVGLHATQACSACHKNGIYKGTPRDCAGCHLADYQRTANPNHQAAGFPTTCDSCHRPTDASFKGGGFNHSSVFSLVGIHATQACTACHKNGIYKGTPRDCAGCHLADYQRTASPNHQSAGFPTTCESCHRPTDASFKGANFNHASFFQLVGVHATQACTACHKNNVYKGTPRDCVGCHQADYQRTTNPNHAVGRLPHDVRLVPPAERRVVQGRDLQPRVVLPAGRRPCHAAVLGVPQEQRLQGHPARLRQLPPVELPGTQNPNHAAAGFPTTCDSCHKPSDASWHQAVFNHTWFPITSGRHAGNVCSACHTDRSNYKVFSCLGCHTQSSTASHHTGVAGFRYDSNACYSCHPTGRAG